MSTVLDHQFMARAIQLARSSIYSPHPNPRVGCVITRDEQIIGEGWHAYAGGPHAEVYALEQVGEQASGATAYVTLEPCSHHGRTPPCADALVRAGVARVVVAMQDPNPVVTGNGIKCLQEAGIPVEVGVLESDARQLNPGFIQRMETGRPRVVSKMAMSLDGRTAMASGESQWITSPDARRDVQRMRAGTSAIMTSSRTLLMDDPSLTLRVEESGLESPVYPEQGKQPLRVVIDSDLATPASAKMLSQPGATLIFTCNADEGKKAELIQAGAEVVLVDGRSSGRVDMHAVMDELGQRQVNDVMVEAGSLLNGGLLEAGLIDEMVIYMAPVIMGTGARGMFHLPFLTTMAEKFEIEIRDIRPVGKDWRITAVPVGK